MPSGLENLGIDLIFPGFAGRARDQVAEQPDSGVGVLIGRRQLGSGFVVRSPSKKIFHRVILDASPFEPARQVGRIVRHSRGEVRQLQWCQLLRPERVAVRHVLLGGSVGDDLVAFDGQREQRGGERLGAGADLHQGFARERSARVGSLSIREELAMAVQRNRDDRSQMRRSAPSAATGVTLSLGQVRLHDAVDYSLDRCFLAGRIGL
jgi:hypothetical protein